MDISYICTALKINKYIAYICIYTVYKCIHTPYTVHMYSTGLYVH